MADKDPASPSPDGSREKMNAEKEEATAAEGEQMDRPVEGAEEVQDETAAKSPVDIERLPMDFAESSAQKFFARQPYFPMVHLSLPPQLPSLPPLSPSSPLGVLPMVHFPMVHLSLPPQLPSLPPLSPRSPLGVLPDPMDERQAQSAPPDGSREAKLMRLQRAEELKGHLEDWMSRSRFASGIDVDDQKLTIFCPKEEEEAVLTSLETEVRTVLGIRHQDFLNSFKVKPYKLLSIRRQQGQIGSGSHIYHLDQHGKPLYVTLGAFFIDLIGNNLYCLTTSHLEDAKGKTFFFKTKKSFAKIGQCVAFIQDKNPLLEACLIKIDEAAYDKCSPVLLPEHLQSRVAFRGPYTGSISELLAAPQEVMLCGGQTDLTRGRMKYYAFDFTDPDTNNKVYGGIVTLPIDQGDFVDVGDSGATISVAAAQSFLVKDWCLGTHTEAHTGIPAIKRLRRDARPSSDNEPAGPSTDKEETWPKTLCQTVEEATGCHDDVVKIKIIPEHCAEDPPPASVNPYTTHVPVQEQTLIKTTCAPVVQASISLEEVMTHEAISTHCFSGRIEYEDEPPEYGSVSFRMDLAVEKLQEQIGAELRLVPILKK